MDDMIAAVYHGPFDVRIERVPRPSALSPDEVRLRVLMASLCGTDATQYREATMIPLTRTHPASNWVGPVILGHEFVGVVEAVGSNVGNLRIGQRVVPGAGMWCGECQACKRGRINICEKYFLFGIHAPGGLAGFVNIPAAMCLEVPEQCSDEAAAMAQAFGVALHALSRVPIQAGMSIAFFGVGNIGSLMLAALQAQAISDLNIIAVDVAPIRLALASTLGAALFVNSAFRDPVAAIHSFTNGLGVDISIETTGVAAAMAQAYGAVCRGGIHLQVGIPHEPVPLDFERGVTQEKSLITTNGLICGVDLPHALDLLANTQLAEKVGYQIIPLQDLAKDGLQAMVDHRASRKILIDVAQATEYGGLAVTNNAPA